MRKCAKAIQMKKAVCPIFSNKKCWRNGLSKQSLRASHWQKGCLDQIILYECAHFLLVSLSLGYFSVAEEGCRPGMEEEPIIWVYLGVASFLIVSDFPVRGLFLDPAELASFLQLLCWELGSSISGVFFCWKGVLGCCVAVFFLLF